MSLNVNQNIIKALLQALITILSSIANNLQEVK